MPTVYSLPWFYQQFCDKNGAPLAGGYVETKYAGISDDKATYSDAAGTTAHANPVVLDSLGMPDAGPIFLQSGPYDFYVYDAGDNLKATIEGINALSNTVAVDTVDDLRALSAGEKSIVQTLGYNTINDGGGWWYHWSATSTATDDGGGVIQPDSLPAAGRWLAMIPSNREMNVRKFGATCNGITDDTAKLQACDDWCDTNSCIVLIDSNIYVASDPALASKIKLLPSAQFRYELFRPTLDVIIDNNDKTQHFNCAVDFVPILNVNELYPEWFGEDSTTHPIMTSAIASLTDEKTKYLRNVDVGGDLTLSGAVSFDDTVNIAGVLTLQSELNADGGADIEGNVDIDGSLTCHNGVNTIGDVNIQSGTLDGLVIGADNGATTITNDTGKIAVISTPAYSTAEPNTVLVASSIEASDAIVSIGGGAIGRNAATEIRFLTFPNNYTQLGELRGYFTKDGSFVVGAPTGGAKGTGTINAVAVYDDNVMLTGYVLDKAFNPEFTLEAWKKKTPVQAEEFNNRSDMLLDIDKYSEFIESRKMLPTFEEIESTGNIPSTGAMIQKLWEVVEIQAVHIKNLNDRLRILEEPCK